MTDPASSKQRYRQFLRDRAAGRVVPEQDDLGESPAPSPDRRAKRKRYMRSYYQWMKPHVGALAFLFGLATVAAVFRLINPIIIQRIIDGPVLDASLDAADRFAALNLWGLLMIGLVVFVQGIEAIRMLQITVLNAKVIHRLRQRLFNHMMKLPLPSLYDMKSGGITSRLSGDIDNVNGLVQQSIISPGVAVIQVVIALTIIFAWNWRLALATTVCVPPLMLVHLLWVRRIRPIYRSMREDRSVLDGRVAEAFGGVRVVRAFRREPREQHDYAVGHHTVIRKRILAQLLEMIVASGWGLMMPAIQLVIIWYGGYLVIRGQASVGQLIAFQWYSFFLLQPVISIVDAMSQTQRALAAMERVFDVLDVPPDKPDRPGAIEAPGEVREIRFEHVRFEYQPGVTVIDDVDLVVPGGSVVALVGPSGAGKTTLTDLVARFHDPTAGRITLNGIDLRDMTLHSYRQLLGVVEQEVFLFDGTVRDNIAYGRRGADEAAVIDAARRANADGFIRELPHGYDTLIGERGVKLSGGQRQRISIARAILADPRILILDEATSNLDTESEQLIQAALADLLRGRTTFVIAHRLSTITHADMIVVLDRGRIVELGRHDQLLSNRGLYHDMVERQRRSMDLYSPAVT